MNEQMKQSISERMAARQTEAETKIKAILWDDGDPDKVAALALANGVPPERVDHLAVEISDAKTKVQAAIEANDTITELIKAQTKAQSTAATAAKALTDADEADDAARVSLGDAKEALLQANADRDAAARLLSAGIVPDGSAPPFLSEIVARWQNQQETAGRALRIKTLKRQIPWHENRVDCLKHELKEQKASDPKRDNKTIGGGDLVAVQTALEGRLKTEKANLKAARAELVALEKSAA